MGSSSLGGLPIAEWLGKAPHKIFEYLSRNREASLEDITLCTGISSLEVVRGLSILAFQQLVAFTYTRGFRYFVNSKHLRQSERPSFPLLYR